MSGGEAALRVAFDMDGVLADMHAALAIEAHKLFTQHEESTVQALEHALDEETAGAGAASQPPELTLTVRQTEMLWQRVASKLNFWEGLAETEPGIVARLAQVADARRWDVLFVTQRPPTRGATVQKQTQAWLRRHGFDCPSVFTTRGSRGAIAAALHLDVVVDDRFQGCSDVAGESVARAILVGRHADDRVRTRANRLGITVVQSVGECLDLLERAGEGRPASTGLVSRLKDAFRLKQR